jgi:Na+-driven multidrug efflux pump
MRILTDKQYFGSMQFYKKALLIGIPVMLQSLIQSLVSLIDSFMVSGLGDIKMSGVNISGQILNIFMILQYAICTSGGIFLTQFSGAKDSKGMQQSFAFKIVTSFSLSIVYFLATMVFTRKVLSLMVIGNTQADMILDQGEQYMFLMGFIGVQSIVSFIIASSYKRDRKGKGAADHLSDCRIDQYRLKLWIDLRKPRYAKTGSEGSSICHHCGEDR